jgi:hypothetical protein
MASIATDEREGARGGIGLALRTKIELWLAVVFMALAFGAGITIGVIAQHTDTPTMGVTQVNQAPGNFGVAPPLTETQIQQGLPTGHPAVDSDQGSSGSGSSSQGAGSGSKASGGPPQNGSTSGTG